MKGTCPFGQVFFVFPRGLLSFWRQKSRIMYDILHVYLVVQHYLSIFVAETTTLSNMFRRTQLMANLCKCRLHNCRTTKY